MLLSVPVGGIILSACGPEMGADMDLEQASDNYFPFALSEYGHCNDTWDNDGNGWIDMGDPACHINPGPLRDLSVLPYPVGHNFLPVPFADLAVGPGYGGGFRDPVELTRWFRFLTELDGNVAGTDILSPGVNPEIVPIPALLPARINQGTAHPGNNNNVSIRGLHVNFLDHEFLAAPGGVIGSDLDARYVPEIITTARGIVGGNPGGFYRARGPFGGYGSQGALQPARTGNPDNKGGNQAPTPGITPQ